MVIEWPLLLFTVIAGAGAGMLAFAGLSEFFGASKKARFITCILAIVFFVVGGCLSLLHLGNPSNFMSAATNIFSFSPISLELIFLGLGVIVAIIYMVLVNREGTASKVLAICAIVVGALFCYFSGHGYEMIHVRAAWATPALTFSYALSALTFGGFLFLILQAVLKDEAAAIKKVALFVLIVAVLQTIIYVIYGATIDLGDNATLFWVGSVVVGGIVAVVAGLIAFLKSNTAAGMACIGFVAALVGGIAVRAIMWLAGSMFLPSFFELGVHNRSLFPF